MKSQYNKLCNSLINKNTKEAAYIVEASPDYGQALGGTIYKTGRWAKYVFFVKRFIKKCRAEIDALQKKCQDAHTRGVKDAFQFEVEMERDIVELSNRIQDWIKLVQEFILLPQAKTHKAELQVLWRYLNGIRRNCLKGRRPDGGVVDIDAEVVSNAAPAQQASRQSQSAPPSSNTKLATTIPTEYVPSYTHRQQPRTLSASRQARQLN